MTSLIYRVLDAQVIHGLADNLAIDDQSGTMSYAELLHESASIAGAFTSVGITPGTGLHIDVAPGRELVVAVLACARIGVLPSPEAEIQLAGAPPVLHLPDTEVPWHLLIQAGRTDPEPAPPEDPEGYEAAMRAAYPDIFEALEAGKMITSG
jgi:hypothetical protein